MRKLALGAVVAVAMIGGVHGSVLAAPALPDSSSSVVRQSDMYVDGTVGDDGTLTNLPQKIEDDLNSPNE
jgi:hypothetical protein